MLKKITKAMPAVQMLGGALLIAASVTEFLAQVDVRTPLVIALYLTIVVYGGIVVFYGWRMWRRNPSAYLPSAILWILQIPAMVTGLASYSIVTGFGLIVRVIKADTTWQFSFDVAFLERHFLQVGGETNGFLIGINLFAIVCALSLLSAYRESRGRD